MPSDRIPSQAEIEAARRVMDTAFYFDMGKSFLRGSARDAIADRIAEAVLSAAATARPEGSSTKARNTIDGLRADADEAWAIARELYEALEPFIAPSWDPKSGWPNKPLAEHWEAARLAKESYERASLGEGEGGR